MKHLALSILFTLLASWAAVCQERGKPTEGNSVSGRSVMCSENRDKLYVRQDVLKRFANILSASIPEFERERFLKFEVINEKPHSFGVYDLTDTSNVDKAGTSACIEFVDNHIYHVVPLMNDYSFSHIVVLEGGSLKVFRSINCRDRGDKLEDVIAYLNLKFADDKNKDEIIKRVTEYRKYGRYVRMDNFSSLRCDRVTNKP